MAAKRFLTRRGNRSHYRYVVWDDEEQTTELNDQHRSPTASTVDTAHEEGTRSHCLHEPDHGDVRDAGSRQSVGGKEEVRGSKESCDIDEPEMGLRRAEKDGSSISAGFDAPDMPMRKSERIRSAKSSSLDQARLDKNGVEKQRVTRSSDHADMSIKISKDLSKGPKRRMSEDRDFVYQFTWFDILIGVGSIIVFITDIVTDIKLAVDYFLHEEWFYGGVTTALIVGPSLVTCCFGLHWYIIDYKTEKEILQQKTERKGHVIATPPGMWFCRFFFTVLQFGPVIRTVEYLYYGCKSQSKKIKEEDKRRYHWWMLYEDVDNMLLRLFESFLESAPQLTWQLYVLIKTKPQDDFILTTTRSVALLSSWASLALSLVSYQRSLRNSRVEKEKLEIPSVPFYFIWRATETGARVLCIAMFASAFDFWVFGILLFHWVFMSVWLMNQRTTFYTNRCLEKVFNVICGYVMLFCFLNLREGNTRYRFLIYYFVFYVENFIMLAFWFRFTPDLGTWFHIWGFISVLILFVLHVVFQLVYYTFFHPTNSIKFCLNCDKLTFYESVCYDIQPEVDDGVGSPSKRYTSQEMVVDSDMPDMLVAVGEDARNFGEIPQERENQNGRSQDREGQQEPKPRAATHQDRVAVHGAGNREDARESTVVHNIK